MSQKNPQNPPILLGTHNPGKIREMMPVLTRIFPGRNILTLVELEREHHILEIPEGGTTYLENALLKARALRTLWEGPVLTEDSGLEVAALDGAPGIFSRRYAGEGASDKDNVQRLLRELSKTPKERRQARFVAVSVLYLTEEEWVCGEGVLVGEIATEPRGEKGFGYDPIFVPTGENRTVAELSLEEKVAISHRTQALLCLAKKLLRCEQGTLNF